MDTGYKNKTWIQKKLEFTTINVWITQLGEDYNITVGGGESPHIGCTVLALPRPSLTGDGTIRSTSSVINVTGHKDDIICRKLAETVSAEKDAAVVCSGGVHIENITLAQIKEIERAIENIAVQICGEGGGI